MDTMHEKKENREEVLELLDHMVIMGFLIRVPVPTRILVLVRVQMESVGIKWEHMLKRQREY